MWDLVIHYGKCGYRKYLHDYLNLFLTSTYCINNYMTNMTITHVKDLKKSDYTLFVMFILLLFSLYISAMAIVLQNIMLVVCATAGWVQVKFLVGILIIKLIKRGRAR